MPPKSTVDRIRERFDQDVERFSNLETGQTATVDAALALDLVARAAARTTPDARGVLDLGCGAGNFTLKLLERLPGLSCTLLDLSLPMLERAQSRIAAPVSLIQGDLRTEPFPADAYDIVLAAAVLHHLRTEQEWQAVCAKLFQTLRPGGSLWIFDLVSHEIAAVQDLLWGRYAAYLEAFKGQEYRETVFRYIEEEDSPIPATRQCELLRAAGFQQIDILHKNNCFAALGARKPHLNQPRAVEV